MLVAHGLGVSVDQSAYPLGWSASGRPVHLGLKSVWMILWVVEWRMYCIALQTLWFCWHVPWFVHPGSFQDWKLLELKLTLSYVNKANENLTNVARLRWEYFLDCLLYGSKIVDVMVVHNTWHFIYKNALYFQSRITAGPLCVMIDVFDYGIQWPFAVSDGYVSNALDIFIAVELRNFTNPVGVW